MCYRPGPHPCGAGGILGHIAEGVSDKRITRELHCAVGTVKVHAKNLLKESGRKRRMELAVWALNTGDA